MRKLDNILKFEDFVKSNEEGDNPKVIKEGYVKLREDYIHSFIDEHERDHELPEEE